MSEDYGCRGIPCVVRAAIATRRRLFGTGTVDVQQCTLASWMIPVHDILILRHAATVLVEGEHFAANSSLPRMFVDSERSRDT
jgi:hypothetical protein